MQGACLDHGDHEREVGPFHASAHIERSDKLQLRQEMTLQGPDADSDGGPKLNERVRGLSWSALG